MKMNNKKTIQIIFAAILFFCGNRAISQNVKFEGGYDKFGNMCQLMIFDSKENLKCNDTVRVYTPDGEIKGTLLLLHGWSGCYKDWGDKMDIQKISNKWHFRIITPDGFYNSWYVDHTHPDKMQTRKFFNEELIPFIVGYFKASPENFFIDGLSMGGHGAINIFIDNHDLFRAGGSMSGVLDLEKGRLKTEIVKMFEEKLDERLKEESATYRIKNIANSEKPILISCGYSDFYFFCSQEIADACKENNVYYIRLDSPGTHSWKFWEFALNQHLWYFERLVDGEEMGFKH